MPSVKKLTEWELADAVQDDLNCYIPDLDVQQRIMGYVNELERRCNVRAKAIREAQDALEPARKLP